MTVWVETGYAAESEPGKKIFVKHCKVCHGERGNTNNFAASVLDPPPRNFASLEARKELTQARMIQSVTHGRPGTAMMPWKDNLTEEDIRSVVRYIRRAFMGLMN